MRVDRFARFLAVQTGLVLLLALSGVTLAANQAGANLAVGVTVVRTCTVDAADARVACTAGADSTVRLGLEAIDPVAPALTGAPRVDPAAPAPRLDNTPLVSGAGPARSLVLTIEF